MRRTLALSAALLAGLAAIAPVEPGMRADANAELKLLELGQTPPRRIPGAAFRVAVFAYEDPDRTGLGDQLAALVERTILNGNSASSLGVLRYEGDLSPQRPGDLGYFDKVDRLVASQDVALAVWGRISRSHGELVVDTYAQVPPKTVESRFTWRLRLPQEMGGAPLLARLRPNRFALQRLQLPLQAADAIRRAAQRLDELRGSPAETAPIVGRLPQDQVYPVVRQQGDWVFLQVRGGPGGWVRSPSCPGECARVFDAAAFAGGLIGYMARGVVPAERPGLTPEALAVRDQLLALDALGDPQRVGHSLDLARRWSTRGTRPSAGGAPQGRGLPPGGAAAANAQAMAQVSGLLMEGFRAAADRTRPELESLRQGVREGRIKRPAGVPEGPDAFVVAGPRGLAPIDVGLIYDRIPLDKAALRSTAQELVDAALLDPRNPEILNNIAVLFRSTGDAERAAKAEHLAAQLAAPPGR